MLRDLGLAVTHARANVRHGRSHHPHRQPQAALSATSLAEGMVEALKEACARVRHHLLRRRVGAPGHRAHHRPRARPHAAGDHHRLRRLAHLDARRVRRHRHRHRHHAGARRAGHAMPGARSSQGAPHRGDAASSARASTPKTSSCTSSAVSASFGGTGYAYEYAGSAIEALSMEERMTLCNMSIEGGARVGYVNPDEKTFAYMKGRPYAPQGDAWDARRSRTGSRSRPTPMRTYDDVVRIDAAEIAPTVTWGINPGQAISVKERIPTAAQAAERRRALARRRGARVHAARRRAAHRRHAHQRRVHRQLHQRAPLRFSRSGALPQGQEGGIRRCARSRSRARWTWRARPKPKGSIRFFATRASSGASPDARCAWP